MRKKCYCPDTVCPDTVYPDTVCPDTVCPDTVWLLDMENCPFIDVPLTVPL